MMNKNFDLPEAQFVSPGKEAFSLPKGLTDSILSNFLEITHMILNTPLSPSP
jgi:hypothetical protein